jgi:hypothetical protein
MALSPKRKSRRKISRRNFFEKQPAFQMCFEIFLRKSKERRKRRNSPNKRRKTSRAKRN